ncbi:hypothetical protein L6249_02240 [Candidatus Parcubacteria bacterium]|nr:hypothetical protein [Candidatus Parcubacteria bacterium]
MQQNRIVFFVACYVFYVLCCVSYAVVASAVAKALADKQLVEQLFACMPR